MLPLLTVAAILTSAPTALSPILPGPLPDPHAVYIDGHWSIFGTGSQFFFYYGESLDPESMERVSYEVDFSSFGRRPQIWGLVPHQEPDGSWHAFATLHIGGFRTVLAHLLPQGERAWTGESPIDRWVFDRVIVGDIKKGDWSYYETKYIRDGDDAYLVYVAHERGRNKIFARRMLDPATPDPAAEPVVLLEPQGLRSEDRNNPGGLQLVEGQSIKRINGLWTLLYSVGDFNYPANNYKLGIAYSNTLIPEDGQTYHKVTRVDSGNIWGNGRDTEEVVYLMQSQKQDWPNDVSGFVRSPGLGSIISVGDTPMLLFHGYRADQPNPGPDGREVFLLPVEIDIPEGADAADNQAEWVRIVLPQ